MYGIMSKNLFSEKKDEEPTMINKTNFLRERGRNKKSTKRGSVGSLNLGVF